MPLAWRSDEAAEGYVATTRDVHLRTFELDGRWHWESFVGRAEDVGQGEAESLEDAKEAAAKCVRKWLTSVVEQL